VANEVIGYAPCPLRCGSTRARVCLSQKKQLAYITCNACHCQVFARGDHSDRLIRDMIAERAEQSPPPAPPPPVVDPAPGPAPAPQPVPARAPGRQRDSWDIF
jgi:hypothetical protein